ncbi:MAG: hypothetical protein QNK36_21505 [Colwellia sp.]|nr:hypothetical protein [Colwellia sp.]
MNNIFISCFSFGISGTSDLTLINASLKQFSDFIGSIPKYNKIAITKDFLTFKNGDETFKDIIFEACDMQRDSYEHYLRKLEKIMSSNKSDITTDEVIMTCAEGPIFRGNFASVYFQVDHWPNISEAVHVSSSSNLYELNCQNLERYPISNSNFSERAEVLFSNVIFHPKFSETITTVKTGNFEDYSVEFVIALRALHNAVPLLTDKGHNPPDLTIIKTETGKLGRTMDCSPQGPNKNGLYYDFKIFKDEKDNFKKKKINCEYHLKINFDNTGEKLNKDYYNRAYFGLPLIDGKKRIVLAFMGKHY